jgi:hypothetical protein
MYINAYLYTFIYKYIGVMALNCEGHWVFSKLISPEGKDPKGKYLCTYTRACIHSLSLTNIYSILFISFNK